MKLTLLEIAKDYVKPHRHNFHFGEEEGFINDLVAFGEHLQAISQMQPEWVEINNVEDLPTEEGQFYVHQKVWYEPFFQINTFSGRLTNAVIHGKPIFSHYMKVVLPQPPTK